LGKIQINYNIEHPGETAAGLRPYYNEIKIKMECDPGGEDGEFAEYMRECLNDWFDGAKVEIN
jgi:hypothetical protein